MSNQHACLGFFCSINGFETKLSTIYTDFRCKDIITQKIVFHFSGFRIKLSVDYDSFFQLQKVERKLDLHS